MIITWWMKLGGNLPRGYNALLFSISGTGSFICLVTQTRLDIPRPLITQSHRHGWTYQGLWLPSHIDTAGHTKAFDYPVTQTRLDIPRPLITQSHRHGWTHQGLYLPSHGPQSQSSGTRQIRTADLSVHSQTHKPSDHPKSENQLYPGSSMGGGGGVFSLLGNMWVSLLTSLHVIYMIFQGHRHKQEPGQFMPSWNNLTDWQVTV